MSTNGPNIANFLGWITRIVGSPGIHTTIDFANRKSSNAAALSIFRGYASSAAKIRATREFHHEPNLCTVATTTHLPRAEYGVRHQAARDG